MSLTQELAEAFLPKLQEAVQTDMTWLKFDLYKTVHLRLVCKLHTGYIHSSKPLSELIKTKKASILIKSRKTVSQSTLNAITNQKQDNGLLVTSMMGHN